MKSTLIYIAVPRKTNRDVYSVIQFVHRINAETWADFEDRGARAFESPWEFLHFCVTHELVATITTPPALRPRYQFTVLGNLVRRES